MQPSVLFDLVDATDRGFKFKRTTSDYGTLFPLFSELDTSIAYTMPTDSRYTSMCPMFINKQAPQRGLSIDNWFQHHYYTTSAHSSSNMAWSCLGDVEGNNGDDDTCVLFWTFATSGAQYYFNGDSGNAVIGTSTNQFISGFDISHVIFQADIRGYTKAQFDAYKVDGSSQTEDTILLSDLIDNPTDYIISRFSISAVACWDSDNNTWINNPPVQLTCLLHADSVQGVANPQNILAGDMTTASVKNIGINRMSNYHLYSATKNYKITDSTYYRRLGGIPAGLDNDNQYGLGSSPSWYMRPPYDATELQNMIDGTTSASSNNKLTPALIMDNGIAEIWGYDNYNISNNYSNPPQGQFHYSKWDKALTCIVKGDVFCSFLASAGCYFQIGGINANYNNTLNNNGITPDTLSQQTDIGLGVMNDDGTTDGTWIIGEEIEDYQGINKKGDIVHPGFNPSPAPSGNDEDNDDTISTIGAPFGQGLAHYYAMTTASPLLQHISEAMGTWNIDSSKKDLYRNLISCKLIKPPAAIPTSGSEPFTIYGVKPQYQGSDILLPVVSGNPTATFGSYSISRKFGDFRDYSPYTKVEIFLPYCGWCALPSHVVGRSVSVQYYTDIIAATCKAVVFCGNNVVAEASGCIGLDIPFASENVGAKMQAANTALLASTAAAIDTSLAVGTITATKGQKGIGSAVKGLSSYASGFSQMAMVANENWTEISGKTGDGCNLAGVSSIIIKITRPKYGSNSTAPYVPSNYGHASGFISLKTVTVGSVTGYLQADNVDTSGITGATERERQLIKAYLESGIFVNHPT